MDIPSWTPDILGIRRANRHQLRHAEGLSPIPSGGPADRPGPSPHRKGSILHAGRRSRREARSDVDRPIVFLDGLAVTARSRPASIVHRSAPNARLAITGRPDPRQPAARRSSDGHSHRAAQAPQTRVRLITASAKRPSVAIASTRWMAVQPCWRTGGFERRGGMATDVRRRSGEGRVGVERADPETSGRTRRTAHDRRRTAWLSLTAVRARVCDGVPPRPEPSAGSQRLVEAVAAWAAAGAGRCGCQRVTKTAVAVAMP